MSPKRKLFSVKPIAYRFGGVVRQYLSDAVEFSIRGLFFGQAVVKTVTSKFAAEFKAVISGRVRDVIREAESRCLRLLNESFGPPNENAPDCFCR